MVYVKDIQPQYPHPVKVSPQGPPAGAWQRVHWGLYYASQCWLHSYTFTEARTGKGEGVVESRETGRREGMKEECTEGRKTGRMIGRKEWWETKEGKKKTTKARL